VPIGGGMFTIVLTDNQEFRVSRIQSRVLRERLLRLWELSFAIETAAAHDIARNTIRRHNSTVYEAHAASCWKNVAL